MVYDVALAIQQHELLTPQIERRADFDQAASSREGKAVEDMIAQAVAASGSRAAAQRGVVIRLSRDQLLAQQQPSRRERRAALPLLDAVDDLLADVPEEEWALLPPDMASNVERDLYEG